MGFPKIPTDFFQNVRVVAPAPFLRRPTRARSAGVPAEGASSSLQTQTSSCGSLRRPCEAAADDSSATALPRGLRLFAVHSCAVCPPFCAFFRCLQCNFARATRLGTPCAGAWVNTDSPENRSGLSFRVDVRVTIAHLRAQAHQAGVRSHASGLGRSPNLRLGVGSLARIKF
jgi:hypothetical protein